MITQIYSLQTAEEALACIEAGADRIGLLVGVVLPGNWQRRNPGCCQSVVVLRCWMRDCPGWR